MKKLMASVAFGLLLLSACVDGFKDESEWVSKTTNATLSNPTFTKDDNIEISADGSTVTIKWAVVPGAKGYQLSVYKLTDDEWEPEVLLGKENEVVDGLYVTRPNEEDTEYKLVFKALGNEKFNNRDAAPTEFKWNNMLDVTAEIPPDNPINNTIAMFVPESDSAWDGVELCFQLEAGKAYTMNGNLSLNKIPVTIRGAKADPPTITISSGSFANIGGFKLKDVKVEMTGSNPLINMSLSEANAHVLPTKYPVALQNVEVKGMKNQLIALKKDDAIGTLLIKGCLAGWNGTIGEAAIGGNTNGYIKDCTITESTFYNDVTGSGVNFYFLRMHGSAPANVPGETWTSGSFKLTSSTFYQMGGTQFYNANGKNWKSNSDNITVQKCVFVDSYWDGSADQVLDSKDGLSSSGIIRRLRSQNNNIPFTSGYNTYWWASASHPAGFIMGEINHSNGDKGVVIKTNPQLTYEGNGRFLMMGPDQQSNKTGDPRWLLE